MQQYATYPAICASCRRVLLTKAQARLPLSSPKRATASSSTPTAPSTRSSPPTPLKPVVFNNRNPDFRSFLLLQQQLKKGGGLPHSWDARPVAVPYLPKPKGCSYFMEVFGCQMNVNDAEYVTAILDKAGFTRVESESDAQAILLVTCAIREKAEAKIWNRLQAIRKKKQRHRKKKQSAATTVALLGCMAERLKGKLLDEHRLVDVVCGPDAYRSLPYLIDHYRDSKQAIANVALSVDETYADIAPVRTESNEISAYVSIMRGCNNMCSFCIVPFTRGTERSRPMSTILDEIRRLRDEGVKEVTLLGQNVNSYRDTSVSTIHTFTEPMKLSKDFSTIYKSRVGGAPFAELLHQASLIDPQLRLRFTSPHPKDFPDDLLHLIKERPNIANHVHLPAQSGSTRVLGLMRRGYTREAYLTLVENIQRIIPEATISSDFISGFCGEQEEDHQQTLDLIRRARFDHAFMFAYSMRDKTHASRNYEDDVPEEVKRRRLGEVIETFTTVSTEKHQHEVGKEYRVLVEGEKRKKKGYLTGKGDGCCRVSFPGPRDQAGTPTAKKGDYVTVKITSGGSTSLEGEFVDFATL